MRTATVTKHTEHAAADQSNRRLRGLGRSCRNMNTVSGLVGCKPSDSSDERQGWSIGWQWRRFVMQL